MERKQGFLFRTVDIVMELFAMTAAVSRARALVDGRVPQAEQAVAVADLFCRNSRHKVRGLFRDLWSNEDDYKNRIAARVMGGEFTWIEEGRLDVGLTADSFKTRFLTQDSERQPRVAAGG